MYSFRLLRFTAIEVLFGLFAFFTMGFTFGMVAQHLVQRDTAAMCQEGP